MAPKKYYAIATGRVPGIYTSWAEAKAQIDGFPRARFKGFASREEAEGWLRRPAGPHTARPPRAARPSVAHEPVPPGVLIYTDGGALGNPGPGGYGVVIVLEDERRELCGGFRLTTNNRMELMGCIVALRELDGRDVPVTLFSDSSYVVNGMSRGWAKGWRKNGWIKSDKKPALNSDLWAELLTLAEGLDVTFRWVKGHSGHPENERCDELAVASARADGLSADCGYERQLAGQRRPPC